MSDSSQLPKLPPRPVAGHKGTFGTVLVIGGAATPTRRMLGAPAFTALAALRSGAGLAQVMCPRPIVDHVLTLCPSATGWAIPIDPDGSIVAHESAVLFDTAAESASVIAIGPGLGNVDGVESLVLRAVGQERIPVVVDADALNALARIADFAGDLRAPMVMTPHPGEFRRLAEALGMKADPVGGREDAAEQLARRLGSVVVLKGAGTVVSDGQRTWICTRGHPCLGTAGTGDVLSGLIGALIGQFVSEGPAAIGSITLPRPAGRPLDLFDAARVGVESHAAAGERWAAESGSSGGLIAPDLIDLLPSELERHTRSDSANRPDS